VLNVSGEAVCQTGFATVVTLLDAADAGLVPESFDAVTVNVYAVLAVKALIKIGELAPVAVTLPGEDVTVNNVAVPPRVAMVNGTLAPAPLLVAVPIIGASGRSAIFVIPAEASLNLDPANPEALAFVIAISLSLS
jgi:hypothetical protein